MRHPEEKIVSETPMKNRRTLLKALGVAAATVILGKEDSSPQRSLEKSLSKYFTPPGVLDNWVYERNIFGMNNLDPGKKVELEWALFYERSARRQIVESLKKDVLRLENGNHLSPEERMSLIYQDIRINMKKINNNEVIKQGKTLKIPRRDTVTGEEYQVVIDRGLDDGRRFYRAREIRADGGLMLGAVLYEDGTTKLTFDFKGERFKKANPHILNDDRFLNATITTFNLLVGSVLK